jgi:hypothetical protein
MPVGFAIGLALEGIVMGILRMRDSQAVAETATYVSVALIGVPGKCRSRQRIKGTVT